MASRRSRCFYLSDESYQLIIGLAQLVGGDQWSLSRTLDGLVLLGLAPDRDPATGAYDLAQARRRVLQLELEMGLARIETQEGS